MISLHVNDKFVCNNTILLNNFSYMPSSSLLLIEYNAKQFNVKKYNWNASILNLSNLINFI